MWGNYCVGCVLVLTRHVIVICVSGCVAAECLRNKASSLRILTTHEEKLNDLSEANRLLQGQIAELLSANAVQNTQIADLMTCSDEKSTDVEIILCDEESHELNQENVYWKYIREGVKVKTGLVSIKQKYDDRIIGTQQKISRERALNSHQEKFSIEELFKEFEQIWTTDKVTEPLTEEDVIEMMCKNKISLSHEHVTNIHKLVEYHKDYFSFFFETVIDSELQRNLREDDERLDRYIVQTVKRTFNHLNHIRRLYHSTPCVESKP
jgi:hypothetical protein